MLETWISIGKKRRKLINQIIALDSSRSLEQLSKWHKHNLEKELFLLEHYPTRYRTSNGITVVDDRIDALIKKAKDDGIWDENPVKGKWV